MSHDIVAAKYLLLHDHKLNAQLYKFTAIGPAFYGYEDMNSKGYPFDNSTKKKEEENKKKSYLVFQINQRLHRRGHNLSENFKFFYVNPCQPVNREL